MAQRQSIRVRYQLKVIILILFVIVLKLASLLTSPSYPSLPSASNLTATRASNLSEKDFLETPFDALQNFDIDDGGSKTDQLVTEEMRIIMNKLRNQIKVETSNYKLPSFRDLDDLIPENGGTPMRSIVITTWRSGSTFLGAVLNSHPATFHFSEPLTEFKTVQVRGEPLDKPAVNVLRSLLICNYNVLGSYLERSKQYTWLFTHNSRLWQHCDKHRDICWLPQFLTPVCKLFPFQSMKVVHIRLRLVEQLLADEKLNVRVLYLVRDPRGVLASRSTLDWCKAHDDCISPVNLCSDLLDDYSAATRFAMLFPKKFKIVRYEEMSLRPKTVIPDIFNFFGLQYHRLVQEFVNTHTTKSKAHRYSTYRNSTSVALNWRQRLSYVKVGEIQKYCQVAMNAWGYIPVQNASHQLEFNPLVEPFTLPSK